MYDVISQAKQPESLATELEKGAEPYWIQDVRIAQRKIDVEWLRQRDSGSVPVDEVDGLDAAE